jgi:GSH-dependent disulfide-bond oxidoreductase
MTAKWPQQHPELIQLYTLATPNGQKVSVALEELQLPYEAHRVDISSNEQFLPEFLALNPNNKIPVIVDPLGPSGASLTLFESGAILLYLAEKTGRLLPKNSAERYECIQWLFFQMAGVGPMFGQFGHFHRYAGERCTHPYPRQRYLDEVRRLLGVLEQRLQSRQFLMGAEYSIADIATFPWVGCLDWGYDARDLVGVDGFPAVVAWYQRCASRPASQRGLQVGK